MANKHVSEFVQEQWVHKLCASLRMTYKTASGNPPKYGDHVTAHPEFDPQVVRDMDRMLGKRIGNEVYALAFQKSKPRADRLLAAFEASQSIVNRPRFRNLLRRVLAVYESPALVELLRRPTNISR